jgi:sugar transferase EpsL
VLTAYRSFGKRLLDMLGAVVLILCLAPVTAIGAVVVWCGLGFPLLFRQPRPGKDAAPFLIIKFRTMRERMPTEGGIVNDDLRLSPVGRLLRGLSVDELPELWNVLRGDMSLVGPRPLLMQYLERYTPEQARRHEVRPGITGWAQVNGRNAISWEEKLRLDVWYVDNCSFTLDMKILALTVWQVIACRGINQPGHATAQEFMGSSH